MTDTTSRPVPPQTSTEPQRGLTARVSLGRIFAPVPSEFLLIASAALLLTIFGLVMVLSATMAESSGTAPFGPLIKQGVFAAEVKRWVLMEGSMTAGSASSP